jgi:tetratricopeptide (TPR) repeat protein
MAGQYSPRVRATYIAMLFGLVVACSACHKHDKLAEARALQAEGDLYGSLEPLRELIAERPDDPEVHFLYGGALTALGHVSQGEFSLEKAMEDPKWRVRAGIQLAMGALQMTDYPRAIEMAGRVLESEPDQIGALLIRAEARARDHKDLELALADADRAAELDPDRLDTQKPRILALLALDRVPEAEKALADLGKRLDEKEGGQELAGWHCATEAVFNEEKGVYEQDERAAKHAEELWKGCLERFPADPDVVANAVEHYDDQGDRERAIEVLRGALAKEPTADEYRAKLAERLRAEGKPEEGEAVLREAAEAEDPYRAVIAGFELAEHFQALGDYARSLEAAERAMRGSSALGPPTPQILFEYADALLLADQVDRAEAVAQQMKVPAHRELVLARVAQERGDYKRAAHHYDEAFRLWPDNGDARFTAAVAAEANGDFTRAIEQYRYAIRIQSNDLEARTHLARLHLAEGKPGLALEMLAGPDLPPGSDADLLALRLRVQQGEISGKGLRATLDKRSAKEPAEIARALASVAEGLYARRDAAGALRLLREQKRVSMRDPDGAPALRAFVTIARESGEARAAVPLVRDTVAAHPEAASAHELLGRALEAAGAPPDQVRSAYERALELDPKDAGALLGLGRLALARDANEALGLFDRATAAAGSDEVDAVEAVLGGARALVAANRSSDAEARLGSALPKHPLAGALAGELADLRAARGEFSDETLALARRALRFGGGGEAWGRLARIHTGRGDREKAAEALAHAHEKSGGTGKAEPTDSAD